MHDIDRTLTEMETESEYEGEYEAEFESDDDPEFESDDDAFGEVELEDDGADAMVGGHVLDDAEEMEAASRLMSVSSDEELEQFLGGLFKKVTRKVGRFLKKGVGRRLMGTLKGVVKKALPIWGSALGTAIAPGVGTAFGGKLGGILSGLFEVEMEGVSPEDQEFEAARCCVRIAAQAAANAAKASRTAASPDQITRSAVVSAARKHAPRSVREAEAASLGRSGRRKAAVRGRNAGRWVRRGKFVIVIGA